MKQYYDYSRGLKAPYSIQIIKTPKGKVIWVFSQPVSLSFFLALFAGVMVIFGLFQIITLPIILGVNLNLILLVYPPYKFARWYSETEIDGKHGLIYIKDCLIFLKKYVLDSREIYRFERVNIDDGEEFTFRR
ncbi:MULTISPECIES: conjugal transfer protein [unclassified Enterococcus]|uniref:conjugal transfer protein n=1 Tax=unclassified Enterococcus TaxID=2608891 RepID=UPI001555E15E|nr:MULTISPECIES: conjugal transfer protein [unclassified Enterococcus]MBS7576969.1 conjugal transfer protein [Enterococcus sp. MMGLQ5-2]MBS7584376.1 conjugal transfer protein [Enterococcus sp. MMGLQ5-1]NPD12231.1 conjugal transfer protein [Enterococcus sp. MMGLQ5-1]NPD36803.1 conjugal transfer protein [Enterococcus sp. MMGLQ5-2]